MTGSADLAQAGIVDSNLECMLTRQVVAWRLAMGDSEAGPGIGTRCGAGGWWHKVAQAVAM